MTVAFWRVVGVVAMALACWWAAWEYTRNMDDRLPPDDDGRWWS